MSTAGPAPGADAGQERGLDRVRSVFPDGHRRGGAVRDAAAGHAGKPAVGPDRPWARRRGTRRPSRISGEAGGLTYRGYRLARPQHVELRRAAGRRGRGHQLAATSWSRLAAVRTARPSRSPLCPSIASSAPAIRLGDPDETALVFLSDPTIRRWCGPRWRIADSRRTRAGRRAGRSAGLAARRPGQGHRQAGPDPHRSADPRRRRDDADARGRAPPRRFGTLEFMTPIGEIPLDEVTQAEADAYRRVARRLPAELELGLRPDRPADQPGQGAAGRRHDRDAAHLRQRVPRVPVVSPRAASSGRPPAIRTPPWPSSCWPSTASRPCSGAGENLLRRRWARRSRSAGSANAVYVYADDDPFWNELAKVKEDEAWKVLPEEPGPRCRWRCGSTLPTR